jgi:hypothetical protein
VAEDASMVSVRAFGVLGCLLRDRGLASPLRHPVPPQGVSAAQIAAELDLPLDRIEGVFDDHVIHNIDHTILPGHSIAFVPYGTPGPHRFFLGLYEAGKPGE